MKKTTATAQNISVSKETHSLLVAHILKIDGKLGKFADKAIKEKIEREEKLMRVS
jgi:hypothetical protein